MSRNVSGPMSLIRLKRKSLRHKDEKKRIMIYSLCDWQSITMYTSTSIESLFIHFITVVSSLGLKENPGPDGEGRRDCLELNNTTPCPVEIKSPGRRLYVRKIE